MQKTDENDIKKENPGEFTREFFLQQALLMCPTASMEAGEAGKLKILHHRIKRVINCLSVLNNYDWSMDIPQMQLASGYYMTNSLIPKKERLRFSQSLSSYTEFNLDMAKNHDLIASLLSYYSRLQKQLQLLIDSTVQEYNQDE